MGGKTVEEVYSATLKCLQKHGRTRFILYKLKTQINELSV